MTRAPLCFGLALLLLSATTGAADFATDQESVAAGQDADAYRGG